MKIYVIAPLLLMLAVNAGKCKNKKEGTVYKGRLEIKAICMNYTIKLLEGNLDTTKVMASWKDESTGKTHSNVFALGSPCSFPSVIKEGDEFYFTIDPNPPRDCAVCMAYYPKPPKSVALKLVNKE
jgi:hypothetical protein